MEGIELPATVFILTQHEEYEGFAIKSIWFSEYQAREELWGLVAQGVKKNSQEGVFWGVTHFYELSLETDPDVPSSWYQLKEFPLSKSTLEQED